METYTRKRLHGTVETLPATPEDRINAIRTVVKEKQYAKIDDCMIDLFSASLICQIYDALNDTNKTKFADRPAPVMAEIAYKLVN